MNTAPACSYSLTAPLELKGVSGVQANGALAYQKRLRTCKASLWEAADGAQAAPDFLARSRAGGYISFVIFKRHVATPKRLEARSSACCAALADHDSQTHTILILLDMRCWPFPARRAPCGRWGHSTGLLGFT